MKLTPDGLVTIALVLAFAALVTLHIAVVFGLFKRRAPALAVASLLFPPVAPYGAFVKGMRVRAIVWIVAAAIYVAAFLVAR